MKAAEPKKEATSMNPAALQQLIASLDEKHDDAHLRVRTELSLLKNQLDSGLQSVRAEIAVERTVLATYAATPVDVTKLVLSPRIVFTIVVVVLSIYGTIWASTYGLGSDVRDIITRIDAQNKASEAAAKLLDVRAETVNRAIEDMKRRQESQAAEIQSLREAVLTGKINSK